MRGRYSEPPLTFQDLLAILFVCLLIIGVTGGVVFLLQLLEATT